MNAMNVSRDDVYRKFLEIQASIDEDLDPEDVTESSWLVGDTSWRSIEIAYIASQLQEHFGRALPFETLFEDVSKRPEQDIRIGEFIDFVHRSLPDAPALPDPVDDLDAF